MEVVRDALSTEVLLNISGLGTAHLLRGQSVPECRSRRSRFIGTPFYPLRDGRPVHRHRHAELMTVLEGELTVLVADRAYVARAGDWILPGPNVLHGECPLPHRKACRVFGIRPMESFGELEVRRYQADATCDRATARTASPVARPFAQALRWLRAWPALPVAQAKRWLVGVCVWCMLRVVPTQPNPTRRHPAIARVKDRIFRNVGRPVPIAELAAEVDLSPNYLSDLFRAETGMTLHAFSQRHRLNRARELLADPRLRLKRIARVLGFGSPSHFSRAFRKQYGITPSAYRATLADQET